MNLEGLVVIKGLPVVIGGLGLPVVMGGLGLPVPVGEE